MNGVKLARKIRTALGLTAWAMHKRMRRNSVQAYIYLERESKSVNVADLLALRDIAVNDLGWTDEDFVLELRKEIETRKRGKKNGTDKTGTAAH